MSEKHTSSMHDTISIAFEKQGKLNEALADESTWDKATKTRMRKELNQLKGMMDDVLKFKNEMPGDVVEGIEDVIVNMEAKLDGKPMKFKADEVLEESGDLAA